MLAIKFRKTGKKHQSYFRVVVMEKKSKLMGRYIDNLGWVNPHSNELKIDKEKVLHWIKNGAKPTESVHNILIKNDILKGKKISVHKIAKKKEA